MATNSNISSSKVTFSNSTVISNLNSNYKTGTTIIMKETLNEKLENQLNSDSYLPKKIV